jgi:Vitamin B12 dependent methionine synthase, activation domain.
MMSAVAQAVRAPVETIDTSPLVDVLPAEYRRLLGYPRDHVPGERALELAAWARRWYAEHGRPWVYLREAALQMDGDVLRLDGIEFQSKTLREHLRASGAQRAMLVAVSAGHACEEHARHLWQESKPDEYFFLEIFGSAVVEHLVANLSGRICEIAERDGWVAVPHYSPGYTGWDIVDQNRLFEVIASGATQSFPEPLEVLSSGMLRPKKSLLAVVGLAPQGLASQGEARRVPCETCGLPNCGYRRVAYRHAPADEPVFSARRRLAAAASSAPLRRDARYSTSTRALQKWSSERVRITPRNDGGIEACFRFDGTTCSNMGQPLAFDYRVSLAPAAERHQVLAAECRPAEGDEGYRSMCAYLSDPEGLMDAIAAEHPLIGQPLDAVLDWTVPSAPSGCYCSAASRGHKWRLALEAIHYTLAHPAGAAPSRAVP